MHSRHKDERKTLRRLAAVAHERELREHLMVLHDRFQDWLKERIDGFAMRDLIQEFHDRSARDLAVIYDQLPLEMQVARALVRGLLSEEEVPQQFREEHTNAIDFFKEDARQTDAGDAD